MQDVVVALVLAVPVLGALWLGLRRAPARPHDHRLRAGRDDRPSSGAEAALRAGGENGWMRHGGG